MKRYLGVLTLVAASAATLATPGVAFGRDWHHDEHARHEYEKRLRQEQKAARKELEREQRYRARTGYYNRYYRTNPSYVPAPAYRGGYYDRFGVFHPYVR